ncbi:MULTISPECIES: hypothetical protein [unclassified Bartonella]|uniref:hypothetical protein n=1 Tax=unclassified Bartonella TaxID=2645622 RepID=UPI0023608A9C|nr:MULTISPECIES: hypothetical protein [unclassified Bartonella]
MNIRYFFIASAVTSGLALAIQQSDCIVNKKPSPIVAPYNVEKTNLQFFEPISGTSDTLNILLKESKTIAKYRAIEEIYHQGKNLLHALIGFIRSIIMYRVQMFFLES